MPAVRIAWFTHRKLMVLVLALLLAAFAWPRGKNLSAVQVAQAPLAQGVLASGRVIPPARVEMGVLQTGTVAEVRVREGQLVKAGGILLQLASSEQQAALAQAEANLAQARARFDQLNELALGQSREGLTQADIALAQAEREWQRQQTLSQQGFGSQTALEQSRKERDLAQSRKEAARLQWGSNQKGSDRQVIQASVQSAEAAVQVARAKLAQLTLLAPADALVLTRSVEPGQTVQVGKTLLVLAIHGATRLSVPVDEKHLAYLRPGLTATVVADAFPGQPFSAVLSEISPAVDPQKGTVELKLDVPQPPAFLRADMTVSADILVAQKPKTLVLSADAVRRTNGQSWVWVVRDGRAVRQTVALGLSGVGSVEVVKGLAAGEWVVTATDTFIEEGQRITPQGAGAV